MDTNRYIKYKISNPEMSLTRRIVFTQGYDALIKKVSNNDLLTYLLNTNNSKDRNYNIIYPINSEI